MSGLLTAMRGRWARSLRPRRLVSRVRCCLPLRRGTTVVIANWNTLEFLQVSTAAVSRHLGPQDRLVVVDGGSADGSQEWMRRTGIRCIQLGYNAGHGAALDIGFASARTRYCISLDVDAFPISDDWLATMLRPLERGARVVGAEGGGRMDVRTIAAPPGWLDREPFVHPACLAMKTRRFAWRGHTFQKVGGDVGERISRRERGHLRLLPPTSTHGPGTLGTVFGDVVFHNFYAIRHRRQDAAVVDGLTEEQARATWHWAVHTLLDGDVR